MRRTICRVVFILLACVATRSESQTAANAQSADPQIVRSKATIDTEKNTATFQALDSNFKVKFPLHPFLGCIGVCPANGEARSSIVPAEFGGNMDAPEVSAGNTLYLPVNVSGALLYFGDGHAAMGDGEVAGSAVEVPMRERLKIDVIKGKRIEWLRLPFDAEVRCALGAVLPYFR